MVNCINNSPFGYKNRCYFTLHYHKKSMPKHAFLHFKLENARNENYSAAGAASVALALASVVASVTGCALASIVMPGIRSSAVGT